MPSVLYPLDTLRHARACGACVRCVSARVTNCACVCARVWRPLGGSVVEPQAGTHGRHLSRCEPAGGDAH